jgi:hypothetical protein
VTPRMRPPPFDLSPKRPQAHVRVAAPLSQVQKSRFNVTDSRGMA